MSPKIASIGSNTAMYGTEASHYHFATYQHCFSAETTNPDLGSLNSLCLVAQLQ
jgi:hypothetical protein